jgi:hypothetical protein
VSVRSDIARLRALTPAERKLLARAVMLYGVYAPGVRLAGLTRARAWFSDLPSIEGATEAQAVRLVSALVRRSPWRSTCLGVALTLQRMLAAQGIGSELRLGVRRLGPRLEAHAWVEREGTVLLDTRAPLEEFAPLEPAQRAR